MNCIVCGKPLTGGTDTFGERGVEMCWEDWSACGDEPEGAMDSWYGLGPHKHKYDEQGRIIIGGTEFLPLPPIDNAGLCYIDGLWFWPDPDAPGCGTWFTKKEYFRNYRDFRNALAAREDWEK